MDYHDMDYHNDPEKLTGELKKASFEHMAAAWNAFDDAMDAAEDKDRLDTLPELLAQAVDHALKSLCVLYSGNGDAAVKLEIVTHLIRERHECFRECDPLFLKNLNGFRENPSSHLQGKSVTKAFKRLLRETETVLKSVESYNFHLRKTVYYTKEAYARDNRRLKIAAGAAFFFFLVTAFLYLVYHNEKPIQEYVTKGQFFWLIHPEDQEAEEISLRFKVFGDGDFHDYTVEAVEPVSLVALRFDPCDEKNAQVWIDFMEIETRNGEKDRSFAFNQGTEKWYAKQDALPLKVRDGSLFIKTTGSDAAIRIDEIPLTDIVKIKLRMKVVLYKSFLQWIFS